MEYVGPRPLQLPRSFGIFGFYETDVSPAEEWPRTQEVKSTSAVGPVLSGL